VLFELLSARPPYDGDSVGSLMAKILVDRAPSVREFRPEVPEGLAQVIARCLEKDVNVRFGDVAELSLALTPFAPRRSMLAVERVHRILGSVPPPAEMLSPSPSRSSLTPGLHGPTPFPSPESLAQPRIPVIEDAEGQKSFAPASTAPRVGHGTTSGWGGIDPQKKPFSKAPRLALLAGVPAFALLVAGYLIFGQKPVQPPVTEVVPSKPPAVVAPAASSPQPADSAPIVAVSAAIATEPPASATPTPSAPASSAPSATVPRRVVKAPPAVVKPAEPASNETRPRDSRLRMDLKK
jgi:serine/threonine-protein kinase